MKKLGKLNLKEVNQMSDLEMKSIVGGSFEVYGGISYSYDNKPCLATCRDGQIKASGHTCSDAVSYLKGRSDCQNYSVTCSGPGSGCAR